MMRHDRNETVADLRAERDRAREECGHEKAMRASLRDELYGFIRRYQEQKERAEAAEAERDEVAGRLSALLCDLTGGRLSKPTYDVPTMAQEIEEHLTRELEIDAEAEVERLRAEIRDRESERADLRDRVQKAEAQVAGLIEERTEWGIRRPAPYQGVIHDDLFTEESAKRSRDIIESGREGEWHVVTRRRYVTAWALPAAEETRHE